MISSEQCRAARALLNWSCERLADAAKVPPSTIDQFERVNDVPPEADIMALHDVFQNAGVEFIAENGGGAGVRLKFNKQDTKQVARLEGEGGIVGGDIGDQEAVKP